MIRVRNETEAATLGNQVPWDQSNLREQFYFTEQQELDPIQLSASLSRILADPAAKERLQVELASNDLQTAVLIVGQNLRSSDVDPKPRRGSRACRHAGREPVIAENLDGARQSVVSGIETLIVGKAPARLRPRRRPIWLAASRRSFAGWAAIARRSMEIGARAPIRALSDYYRNTRQAAASIEPTVELAGRSLPALGPHLQAAGDREEGQGRHTDCIGRNDRRERDASARTRASARAAPRPAAPPPDIGAGIGIGGVF